MENMSIKLAIIGSVLLVGVIIFSNEIYQLFPETSLNFIDATKNDFEKIKDDTIQKTETTIGDGSKLISNQVKDFTESSTESISKNIDDFSESAQQVVTFGGILGNNQNENNNESVGQHDSPSTNTDSSESEELPDGSSIESSTEPPSSTITTEGQTIQTFETLTLTTSQQSNDNVMIHYEDTSGKTISVTVTLRTTEELFTGIFYSSMFETIVQDVTQTSYFVDVIIEHEEYGTLSSSVFNPADSSGIIINGVFSQS